jgi:hypothetical protein
LKNLDKEIFPCEHVEKAWGEVGCGCDPAELIADLKKTAEEEKAKAAGTAETENSEENQILSSDHQKMIRLPSISGSVPGKKTPPGAND